MNELKLRLFNQNNRNVFDCVFKKYKVSLFLDIQKQSFDITIKTIQKHAVLVKKANEEINELKRKESETKSIVFSDTQVDQNASEMTSCYRSIINCLMKDYPTAIDSLESNVQQVIFDKASTLFVNCVIATIIARFDEDDSRDLYYSDFINYAKHDLKKIIKYFVVRLLYWRMRESFFENIRILNRDDDIKYYSGAWDEYIVLTKDNDIKHFSAENLYLVRTSMNPDKAQLKMMSRIRDKDIVDMISKQHKMPLSRANIIDL